MRLTAPTECRSPLHWLHAETDDRASLRRCAIDGNPRLPDFATSRVPGNATGGE